MKPLIIENDIILKLPSDTTKDLGTLAAVHRINCLAGLVSAKHGWLGASFSCIELLTAIYYRFIEDPLLDLSLRSSLHMSKGHAAMAQYAVLAAKGCFSVNELSKYKSQNHLPAHSDRSVVGVDSDSGSLGQGLSKAIGNAIANRLNKNNHTVFAIMGDGELQEGQIFEAFLTLKSHNLTNCIPIIDRNHLQTGSSTKDIKDAEDWQKVFKAIGLNTFVIDGHSFAEILNAISSAKNSEKPSVIIAETHKGNGTSVTRMEHDIEHRAGIWHGKIPDYGQYMLMLKELVEHSNSPFVTEVYKDYIKNSKPPELVVPVTNVLSTSAAFAKSLLELAKKDEQILVLDADLEQSCNLRELADQLNERFIEVGISEQDMCSIASGLALSKKIPVVNTYGSFYKRALDQIFAASTERLPVIFAAHYSGADYFTDGKSHQSVNDIGLIRAIGDIEIFEPINSHEAQEMLVYLIKKYKHELENNLPSSPAYFRLHRTPQADSDALGNGFIADKPRIVYQASDKKDLPLLFANGPFNTIIAINAAKLLAKEDIDIRVAVVNHISDDKQYYKPLIRPAIKVFTLEDHRRETGIGGFIASIDFINPVRMGVSRYANSMRSIEEMFAFHQLTPQDVCKVVKKVLSCVHD